MFSEQRQQHIMKLLRERGTMTTSELARACKVSDRTIRRDLEQLEMAGFAQRTYGGAMLISQNGSSVSDIPFDQRQAQNLDLKRRIAEKALQFLAPGSTIAMDSGTTIMEMAKLIPDNMSLTVVTNAVNVLWELCRRPNIELVASGGILRRPTMSLVGPSAEACFKAVRVDVSFIAATAVSLERGLMNSNLFEGSIKKMMIDAAEKVVLLADSSKFGKMDFSAFAPIDSMDFLITDSGIPETIRSSLEQLGIGVIVA